MNRSNVLKKIYMYLILGSVCFNSCTRMSDFCPDHDHTDVWAIRFTTDYPSVFEGDEAVTDEAVRVYIYDAEGQECTPQVHTHELQLEQGTYYALATNLHADDLAVHASGSLESLSAHLPTLSSRVESPFRGHASYLYSSGIVEFTVEEGSASAILFTMHRRAIRLRLLLTFNEPGLVRSVTSSFYGMATAVNLSTGEVSGACQMIPHVYVKPDGNYIAEALILGGTPEVEPEIELRIQTTDGNTHILTEPLEDVFASLGEDDKEVDVYLKIDSERLPVTHEIALHAAITGWKAGNDVHGTVPLE